MTLRLEARESVGFQATLTIATGGAPVDISGWEFEATFERQAGAPDIELAMALSLSPTVEGFFVDHGPSGRLSMVIPPATLAGIADTTGLFTMFADLLGTPPSGPRQFIELLQ